MLINDYQTRVPCAVNVPNAATEDKVETHVDLKGLCKDVSPICYIDEA